MDLFLLKIVLTETPVIEDKEHIAASKRNVIQISQIIREKSKTSEGLSWTLGLFNYMAKDGRSKYKANAVVEEFERKIDNYSLLKSIVDAVKSHELSNKTYLNSLIEILVVPEDPTDRLTAKLLFNREGITQKDIRKLNVLLILDKIILNSFPVSNRLVANISKMPPQKAAFWIDQIVTLKTISERALRKFLDSLNIDLMMAHIFYELLETQKISTAKNLVEAKPELIGYLITSTDPAIWKSIFFQIGIENLKINFEPILQAIFNHAPEKFDHLWDVLPKVIRKKFLSVSGLIPQIKLEKICSKMSDYDDDLGIVINCPNLSIERKIILLEKNHISIYALYSYANKKTMREILHTRPDFLDQIIVSFKSPDNLRDDQKEKVDELMVHNAGDRFNFLFEKLFERNTPASSPFYIETNSWVWILQKLSAEAGASLIKGYIFSIQKIETSVYRYSTYKGYAKRRVKSFIFVSHKPHLKQMLYLLANFCILNKNVPLKASEKKLKEILYKLRVNGCSRVLSVHAPAKNLDILNY